MKKTKRMLWSVLALALIFCAAAMPAWAKTDPGNQTVSSVLFYVNNEQGDQVLVSHMTVEEMARDLQAGVFGGSVLHNYSLLDRYVTTVHQEGRGFTIDEFVDYAQGKSDSASWRAANLRFQGDDQIAFWEIDQSGFDEMDSYTYEDLYGVPRYNYPLLYEYWNYQTQDYGDPNGVLNRDQVLDLIQSQGQPEQTILAVEAFSQRYMVTSDKYGSGDYNMENVWNDRGLLDSQRALRLMIPVTEEDLRNKNSAAADSRYWIANVLLDMEEDPSIDSLGTVAKPTATMYEDEENYYISFDCATDDAIILFNSNYESPSYTPACEYTGGYVTLPKSLFGDGDVSINCRAVKEGYTDAGVVRLQLESAGELPAGALFQDVSATDWFAGAVDYVAAAGLFNGTTATTFEPNSTMTRAMFATVLYRLAGEPQGNYGNSFSDVKNDVWYTNAILWANAHGLVEGYGGGVYGVHDPVTREQVATVLHRYAERLGVAADADDTEFLTFSDHEKTAAWAEDAVIWATEHQILQAVHGSETLQPQKEASRAEVAWAFYQAVENALS